MPSQSISTVITSIHCLSPRVKQFILRAENHRFEFKPGQHTRIELPSEGDVQQPYTPVNRPGTGTLALAIKTYEEGTVSAYMHERAVGDAVRVRPLGGSLYLRDTSVPVVMASTGTGITPMLAMLRQLLRSGAEQPITFFFGERTRSDLIYRETLDLLSADHENLRVVYVLSDEAWEGPSGFVQDHLEDHLDDLDAPHFYICGVPEMVVATEKRLQALGAASDQIFTEGWEAGVV